MMFFEKKNVAKTKYFYENSVFKDECKEFVQNNFLRSELRRQAELKLYIV